MPEYKSQSEVRQQAEDYVRALQDAGVSGTLLDATFRDYCVKVSTAKGRQVLGNVIVYHNPGKDTYTLVTSELAEKSAKNELEDIWHGMSRIGRETMVGYHAFVDGSFLDNNIGYGAVILVPHIKGGHIRKIIEQGFSQVFYPLRSNALQIGVHNDNRLCLEINHLLKEVF